MWRWREDAALVAGVIALNVGTALTTGDDAGRPLLPLGLALMVTSAVALWFRHAYPYPVLVMTASTALVYYPLGFPDAPVALTLVIALYTVARDRGPRPAIGAAATLALTFALLNGADRLGTMIGIVPLLLLPVVLGEVARGRARQTAHAEERAALAEATRESEALRRTAEERLRIARELHDALGHHLSMISVQAGAALHTREPDSAFEALQAIRTASKDALREMRSVLGVLREPEQPGLAALPELFQRTGSAGLAVHATLGPASPPTPPPLEVQTAAYRIVQEALTNILRHSTATSADVEIRHSAGSLTVTVTDEGGPDATAVTVTGDDDQRVVVGHDGRRESTRGARAGNGLRGMAERAASLGGAFEAGPTPGGGFRIYARLPITAGSITVAGADKNGER